ncbi:MAG: serine hydrolase [Spirochaetales bacterium]|nr:serine hydrolase [Spirochaetales bacterium]
MSINRYSTIYPNTGILKRNGKENITIEHLLTMTSGLEWNEWNAPYSSKDNPVIGIWYSKKDPISYILEVRLANTPGTHFSYYGGNTIILGEIIKNSSNLTIEKFSEKYLFEPLGINAFEWATQFPNGVFEAASGLKLTSRDMAKIGMTFLNKGTWNGERIIPGDWIDKCATPFSGNVDIDVPGEDSGKMGY